MQNLPLDGLLQMLANANATGYLSTVEEVGSRLVSRGFFLCDGMLAGDATVTAKVRSYLNRDDLAWTWRMSGAPARPCKLHKVETVLLECARLNDEGAK